MSTLNTSCDSLQPPQASLGMSPEPKWQICPVQPPGQPSACAEHPQPPGRPSFHMHMVPNAVRAPQITPGGGRTLKNGCFVLVRVLYWPQGIQQFFFPQDLWDFQPNPKLVKLTQNDLHRLKSYRTYGNAKGAPNFYIIGVITRPD